jgi:hypothetical protein
VKEATFCGRTFNESGMRFHPSRSLALLYGTTGQPLRFLQFTPALNWMRIRFRPRLKPSHLFTTFSNIATTVAVVASNRNCDMFLLIRHGERKTSLHLRHCNNNCRIKSNSGVQARLQYLHRCFENSCVWRADSSAKGSSTPAVGSKKHEPLRFMSGSFGGLSRR